MKENHIPVEELGRIKVVNENDEMIRLSDLFDMPIDSLLKDHSKETDLVITR